MNTTSAECCRRIAEGVYVWSSFSPEHRVELTSAAIIHGKNLYVFDPIPLAEPALRQLEQRGRPRAIFLTNENHERDALALKQRWDVPVLTSDGSRLDVPELRRFDVGETDWDGWKLIPLPGGAGGETGFYLAEKRLLIVGDAVFNLPGHGFSILLDRYCEDPALLRQSLRHLLNLDVECLVMSHGEPILAAPMSRLHDLLAVAA
jgi:glyoxylase-like metal-dependent hydrolase (beta-lactamase superfamily II)